MPNVGNVPSGRATTWGFTDDQSAVGAPCSGGEANVVLELQTLGTGVTTNCTGVSTATLGPTVVFQDGSVTTLLSPAITVTDGISVEFGGTLTLGTLTIVPVRKTGQTDCWDLAGAPQSCPGTGHDGDLQRGVAWPNPRFTNNNNGTVTDNLTDLIWMQAPECGTRFDLPDTTWSAAMAATNAMAAGQCSLTDGSLVGDWGLPNAKEFMSLFHYGYEGLAIPNTAGTGQWAEGDPFSGLHGIPQGAGATYWGSTTYSNRADLVWCGQIYDGDEYFCPNGDGFHQYVWMVRGEATDSTPAPIAATGQTNSAYTGDDGSKQRGIPWPVPRFTDNKNGTITDNLTGFVWLKDAGCYSVTNWSGALSNAAALYDMSPGFQDCGLTDGSLQGEWRLPNMLELRTLIHHAYDDMALPNTLGTGQWAEGDPFTDVKGGAYWSSTTDNDDSSRGYNIAPKYGEPVTYPKTTLLYVWPVRDPR